MLSSLTFFFFLSFFLQHPDASVGRSSSGCSRRLQLRRVSRSGSRWRQGGTTQDFPEMQSTGNGLGNTASVSVISLSRAHLPHKGLVEFVMLHV